jgi:gamma-glutamylputrescine oxidase
LGIAPEKLAAVLHGDMCKVYPQLRSARVQVAWSGVMGYAAHKMPLIGRLPESEVPGVWYCTGFGGHGVCPTTIAGEVIARAIADGDSTYQLFKPFGLRWAGGPYLGAMAAQGFYWAYELRDWARELRTNKRAPLAAL